MHWICAAYGRYFLGQSADEAMNKADAYGDRLQLRAVSLIAYEVFA